MLNVDFLCKLREIQWVLVVYHSEHVFTMLLLGTQSAEEGIHIAFELFTHICKVIEGLLLYDCQLGLKVFLLPFVERLPDYEEELFNVRGLLGSVNYFLANGSSGAN